MEGAPRGTEAIAPDGRPLIELGEVDEIGADLFTLRGTACAFEGLVSIRVEHPEGTTTRYHAQASVGGPERGAWEADVRANRGDVLVVGQTEMGDGPGARSVSTREIVVAQSELRRLYFR